VLAAEPVLRRQAKRRDTLLDIFRAVSATVDPAGIASVAIQYVSSWIPAPSWAVVATDVAGRTAILAEQGVSPEVARSLPLVADWTLQAGQQFLTGNLRLDRRILSSADVAVLCFPLLSRGGCVGAILGFDAEASARAPRLSRATGAALQVLLEPVAAALGTALLLKRAEALSVTDDLTRLYNSRYLNHVLRRETKRAIRSGRPLSLLFIDLDGFKSINDTYGHLLGSRALVEAASVIRGSARETDVAARFGGDEFALILPETAGPGALSVAERVCERIASRRFLAAHGLNVRLTASVGIATLPEVAGSADELIQAADSAMYLVKDRGKNGILSARIPSET
jgi:diguanylate cyclase (GGDEF)-like protein